MSVKVVKVNQRRDNFTVYIGREWSDVFLQSPFHNPFHIGRDGDRAEVIQKFVAYWYAPEQAHLRRYALDRITENDVLGCWCAPLPCHGEIIAGYIKWKRQETRLWW